MDQDDRKKPFLIDKGVDTCKPTIFASSSVRLSLTTEMQECIIKIY